MEKRNRFQILVVRESDPWGTWLYKCYANRDMEITSAQGYINHVQAFF